MEPYDRIAWDALEQERQRQLSESPRGLVPERVREHAHRIGRKAHGGALSIPGFDHAEDLVEEVVRAAGDVGAKLAADSLSRSRIISAYRKSGHDVELIADIERLALRSVDEVKPRFDAAYIAAGLASGAAAGFAVSGGEIAALVGGGLGGLTGGAAGAGVGAVPGAGAGAAPGAAVVVTAMAADSAAVLFATARVIFHTAAYYGYDVGRPEERLRALGVLNYATASSQAAKNKAYVEVEKLAGMIVRNSTWKQLDQNVITRILRRIFELLQIRITRQKLGAALPIVGIAIGAALNARTLSKTADAADLLYRQQFLCDKYDLPFPTGGSGQGMADPQDDEDIPIAEVIDDEVYGQGGEEPPA